MLDQHVNTVLIHTIFKGKDVQQDVSKLQQKFSCDFNDKFTAARTEKLYISTSTH